MTTAHEHYRNGDLNAAMDCIADELRRQPEHAAKRAFHAELLCLRGELQQADQQLQLLLQLNPATATTIGIWRQLIRAAQARRDVFSQGRLPEVVDAPSHRIQCLLEILVLLREGSNHQAAERALAMEESRLPCPGFVNGRLVDDLRDLDDCCSGIVEVLASNGRYFWVDQELIVSLALHPPARPLDQLWRRADLVLGNGSEGEVFIPAVYAATADLLRSPDSPDSTDWAALLGRRTDWDIRSGLTRGIGQCTWMAGNEAMALADMETLVMEPLIHHDD